MQSRSLIDGHQWVSRIQAWGLELERIMTMSADNVVELVQVAA
jgi:hypothetical protein